MPTVSILLNVEANNTSNEAPMKRDWRLYYHAEYMLSSLKLVQANLFPFVHMTPHHSRICCFFRETALFLMFSGHKYLKMLWFHFTSQRWNRSVLAVYVFLFLKWIQVFTLNGYQGYMNLLNLKNKSNLLISKFNCKAFYLFFHTYISISPVVMDDLIMLFLTN